MYFGSILQMRKVRLQRGYNFLKVKQLRVPSQGQTLGTRLPAHASPGDPPGDSYGQAPQGSAGVSAYVVKVFPHGRRPLPCCGLFTRLDTLCDIRGAWKSEGGSKAGWSSLSHTSFRVSIICKSKNSREAGREPGEGACLLHSVCTSLRVSGEKSF